MRAVPVLSVSKEGWQLASLHLSATAVLLAAIVVFGLALRVAWVFYTDPIPLGGDPHWYYVVAINLAKGFGFVSNSSSAVLGEQVGPGEPTAFWPPAYPLTLAGFWKLFGIEVPSDAAITSAKVLNAVLGALTIPFVYGIGRALFDQRAGLVAAGLFAVFPNAIAWTPVLFPEQLFTLLFAAALWMLVAFPATSGRRWTPLVAFGVLVGVATLTRGQGAVLIPVAVVYWLMRAGWRRAIGATAVSVLVAVVVITPWTVRNRIQLDAFVPVSTNSAAALRVGHNPGASGTTKWTDDVIDGFRMDESLRRPDWEVKGYREYTRLAFEYAFTHPQRELELTGLKVYHLYRSDSVVMPWLTTLGATPIEPDGLEDALPWLFDSAYYLVLFAAIASLPLWFRREAGVVLLVSAVLFWTLFHVVFLGEPRYHVPLYPVFTVALAAGVCAALAKLAALRGTAAPVATSAPST